MPVRSRSAAALLVLVIAIGVSSPSGAQQDDDDFHLLIAEVGGGREGIWQFIGGTGRLEDTRVECQYSVRCIEDDDLLIFGRCDNN